MTLATKLRDNKAVYAAAGAGDLAIEKLRELPETVTKLRETATRYQGDMRGTLAKTGENVTRYQGELKESVTKLRERVDTSDLPGAAVSYVTHAGTRVAEVIDELAERGKKVVNRADAVVEELETGSKETARKAKTAASETKKTAQAAAKKSGSNAS